MTGSAAPGWTIKEEADACMMHLAGLSAKEIGRRLGRSRSAVGVKLWKLGMLGSQRCKGELMRCVRELSRKRVWAKSVRRGWYKRRMFDWEMALEIGVEPGTVAKARQRAGIPAASQDQSKRSKARFAKWDL